MKKQPPIFYPDSAIQRAAQDELNRKKFAHELAERLRAWTGTESLVLGLYGAWGSGKSSVKNMALEHLREDEATCPHLVEFNPWQISGQEQLTRSFFHEIALQLEQLAGDDKKAQGRAAKWATYGDLLQTGGSLAAGVAHVLPYVGVPGAGAVKAVGETLKKASTLAKHGEKAAMPKDRALSEVKAELRQAFSKGLKKSVLVAIDDIDRLTFEEIRLLFRLVKANADFPRFVYVLLFQKSTVIKALDEECGGHGEAYLEKIVQVGFDVPDADRQQLLRVLGMGIDRILDRLKLGKRFSRERWVNVFFPALQHYFVSLRDVYRFLNVFSFSVSSLSSEDTLEVDPVDLITLEALRVFEHEVYRSMPQVKEPLTLFFGGSSNSNYLKEKVTKALDSLTKLARHPTRVKEILDQLFPNIGWATGGPNYDGAFTMEWKRQLRVCHHENFDRYFFLLVSNRDVSEREILDFLTETDDRAKMVARLEGWKARNVMQAALSHLQAEPCLAKLDDPVPFLTALHDTSDNLPDYDSGLAPHPMGRVSVMRTRALLKERDEYFRLTALKSIMTQTKGLYGPMGIVSSQQRPERPEPNTPPRSYLVSEDGATELRALALDQLRSAAKDGRLAANDRLGYLLGCWRAWGGEAEMKLWVEQLLATEGGVVRLLVGYAQKGEHQTAGSYYHKQVTYIRLAEMEDIVDLKTVTARLKKVARRDLGERERLACAAFDKAMIRKRGSKSDEDFMDDEGDEVE